MEVRIRELARLESVWSKSASSEDCSSTNVSTPREERERRFFCEALRDGYVLCQCVLSLH